MPSLASRALTSLVFASTCILGNQAHAHPGKHAGSRCPFLSTQPSQNSGLLQSRYVSSSFLSSSSLSHSHELADLYAVKEDIKKILVNSQTFWPADYGNYGPLMIRQAWHCAGTYRSSDGRGGCDGARQRFEPERSWDDNTNLDKAKTLLAPVKHKYGQGISWGDLIQLAGLTAIESMGGPSIGFCAGRVDDDDGSESELLGPTAEQEAQFPCEVNGDCKSPLGSTTLGLIYVNPGGPMNVPDPVGSAVQVREVFGRMTMNDYETVALIGGGHTFGKTHGACPKGPGAPPNVDPIRPWAGECNGTFTSGFEGPWVTPPSTSWSNEYFSNLLNYAWVRTTSPAGKTQWVIADNARPGIMMLTSDLSLMNDATGKYQKIVKEYAQNRTLFEEAFAHAWYKLASRDMGPASRCIGPFVPAPQSFQSPLPPPNPKYKDIDWAAVRSKISDVMYSETAALSADTVVKTGDTKSAYYGALFSEVAYLCATTFRSTDYRGGCNGARIRFPPQSDWSIHKNVDKVLQVLQPVKQQFPEASWADIIVYAGQVALEDASSTSSDFSLSFCPGRSDDVDGGPKALSPSSLSTYNFTIDEFDQTAKLIGLTNRQLLVLQARPRSPTRLSWFGYSSASYTNSVNKLSNEYFVRLVNDAWTPVVSNGALQYQSSSDPSLYLTPGDISILSSPPLFALAEQYASNLDLFLSDFASAWTLIVNADRFQGPNANACAEMSYTITVSATSTSLASVSASASPFSSSSSSSLSLVVLLLVLAFVAAVYISIMKKYTGFYHPIRDQVQLQSQNSRMDAETDRLLNSYTSM